MNDAYLFRDNKKNHLIILMKSMSLFLLFCTTTALSQAPESYFSDISLPSPAASEMTRYDAQLPNLFTGTANVQVPLYTIDFDGFSLPITMSYNASGVKVNQEATEAGLGWSLNATGVISRVIKGTNDFGQGNDRPGYINETLDFYNKALNWENLTSYEKIQHQQQMSDGFYDFEPDIFSYNFFGYSGSFVLTRKDANDNVYVKKLNVDPVKIDFILNEVNIKNSYFTVTTPNGFVGYFNVKEFTTNFSGFYENLAFPDIIPQTCTELAGGGINRFEVQKGNFRGITAWYLDRIESPKGKILNFTYNINNDGELSDYLSVGMPSFSEYDTNSGDFDQRGFSRQVVEHVYLEKIELVDEFEIDFGMENRYDLGRFDLFALAGFFPHFPNGGQQTLVYLDENLPYLKRYSHITVNGLESNSILNKQINFHQSYFNPHYLTYGSQEEKSLFLRSRLDGITIDDQNYEFTYYQGKGGLPSKITFGQDHTGGYNGQYTNQRLAEVAIPFPLFSRSTFTPVDYPGRFHYYLQDERKPKLDYAIGGALEKIIYPTGGYSTYLYDLQEFHAEGNQNGSGWTFPNNGESKRVVPPAINPQGDAGTIQLGGLRIKEIITNDHSNVPIGRKSYEYNIENSSQSSGEIMAPLLHFAAIFDSPVGSGPNDQAYIVERSKNIPGKSLAHGNLIGYSRVKETVWSQNGDSYSSVHSFESHPTVLEDRFTSMANFDNMNGQLNLKEDVEHAGINSERIVKNYKVDDFENTVQDEVEAVGYTLHNISVDPILGTTANYAIYPYRLPISFVRPSQVTNTTFFKNLPAHTTTSNFTYDDFAQQKTSQTSGSKNETIEDIVLRLGDYCETCGPQINGKSLNEWMALDNMVSQPLESIRKINGTISSATGYRYGLEHGNVVLKEVFRYDEDKALYTQSVDGFSFGGGYESVGTFDKYNEDGKLLQQTIANGMTTAYIWDTYSNYPIVKGENIGYDELLIAYNDALGVNFEDNLRSHPNTKSAHITTYDADAWVGLNRIVDPAQVSQQFDYDLNERLKSIKDNDQNLLVDYEYNFGSTAKSGGLCAESLYMGQAKPSETITKELEIINRANHGITISDVFASTNFGTSMNWPNGSQVYVAPNDSFIVPVTFTAPTQENDYSGTLTVRSNDLNEDLIIDLFATSINFFSQLSIPKDCYVIGSYQDANDQTQPKSTDTKTVRIENLGNGPLYFSDIESNDDNLIVDYAARLKYNEDGTTYTHYYEIPANSFIDVPVRLFSFTYTDIGDWDDAGSITINYREDDGSLNTADIDYFRYPNQCQNEPDEPPFVVMGDQVADCNYGMEGSVVINSGSIIVFNQTNRSAGQGGSGVVISITGGPGNGIGEGGSIVLTPTTYPTTYTFSSTSATCGSDFIGTAAIVITAQ